jgi:Bacterial Ig-like domain (group 3)
MLRRTRGVQERWFGSLLGSTVMGLCLLAALASPARAATDSLFAAPSGTGNCSSRATACSIATAVTNANAKPVADSVRIELAGGTYSLSGPQPTALPITFAGSSLTLEAASGATPMLSGTSVVRVLSVGSTSKVTIDGLRFELGSTAGLGGAILDDGALTVRHSRFSTNSASNGGAIANAAGGSLAVQDSTFSDNTTTGVGGGAIIAVGTTTVERSAMVDNTAPINGGAINVQPAGSATVTGSTVAGNTSGSLGGGISNLGTLTLQASTITDNDGADGSAIASGNTNVTLAADIITAGSSPACSPAVDPPNPSSFTDAGYNLDDDGTCISPVSPATGSHNGTTALGSSTYGDVLDAYLANAHADNGGATETVALQNTPTPATTLANPAFDVVPASFALPAAVHGVSAACSLADQRGVTPVAGAGCDIGAYLLQATQTALVMPAQAVQNASVTYTATVTPAPDGGTVSFDDGAGNPATSQCAAQPVSGGAATCTVSYSSTGVHTVTATYTGDGAKNNFVGSASGSRTVTVTAPPPPLAPPAMLRCTGREITLLDIAVVRGRATIRGLALVSHRGQTVTLRSGGKRLDKATVGEDGSFVARFKLPKAKGRSRVTAAVAGKTSRAFALERRSVILSRARHGKRVRVTARIVGGRRGATVRIRRQVGCQKTTAFGRARLGRHSRFTISLPLATAAEGVTFYRALARTRRGSTFTLPIAVTTKG